MTRAAFLSIPVQGQRLPQGVYDAILAALRAAGVRVVNEEVTRAPSLAELVTLSPHVVHAHNRALLETAELLVADISRPSLGVGYELAVAHDAGLPVLALCDDTTLPGVSLMIRGLEGENFEVRPYRDTGEIEGIVAEFVRHRLGGTPAAAPDDGLLEHFEGLAAVYDDATEWRQDQPMLQWLALRTALQRRCLDIGTGTGLVGAALRRKGTAVVGVDRSHEMLRRAVPRLDGVVRGDVTALPFRSAAFDGAALRSVLHYVDEIECLREVRRVLCRDGVIVCAQASGSSIDTAAWWEHIKRWTQPLRRRFYTPQILQQFFEAAGFEVVELDSARVSRREEWSSVLRHCARTREDAVRNAFLDAPQVVRDDARLQVTAEGISYEQHWTLIVARPTGVEPVA